MISNKLGWYYVQLPKTAKWPPMQPPYPKLSPKKGDDNAIYTSPKNKGYCSLYLYVIPFMMPFEQFQNNDGNIYARIYCHTHTQTHNRLTAFCPGQSAGPSLTAADTIHSLHSSVSPCTPSTCIWSLYHLQSLSLKLLFLQFNPVISCLYLTICFAIQKNSFWHSELFKSFAYSFCFFSFAEEITLFAFCLLFLYSILASFVFSFFHFPYIIFFTILSQKKSKLHSNK